MPDSAYPAPLPVRLASLLGLVLASTVGAQPVLLNTDTRVPRDETVGDGFSRDVVLSADGGTALFPAFQSNGQQGAVHVFTQAAGAWSHAQRLSLSEDPPSGTFGLQFGMQADVSADGSVIAVSAAATDFEPPYDAFGNVVVFEAAGDGTWAETARLRSTVVNSNDVRYERPIAVSADGSLVAWMGTFYDTSVGDYIPAVISFETEGGDWVERPLVLIEPPSTDLLSISSLLDLALSADGQTLAVGVGHGTSETGYVYVFARDGDAWTQTAVVEPDERPGVAEDFAETIALSADASVMAVGSEGYDQYNGAVYVFAHDGDAWTQIQILTPSDAGESAGGIMEGFGLDVELTADGRFLVATAPEHFDFPTTYRGAAYLFADDGSGTFTERQRTTVLDTGSEDLCGSVDVSADGETVLFGCRGYSNGQGEPGGVGVVLSGFAVSEQTAPVAETLRLAVAPNPTASGAAATVRFELAAPADVRVEVFDGLGRRVAVLHDGPLGAGPHAMAARSEGWPAGLYVVRALAGGRLAGTARLAVVR